MKLSLKLQHHLFWSAIGFGAMFIISAIVFLQLESIADHYPMQYGTEPYTQNSELLKICFNQNK